MGQEGSKVVFEGNRHDLHRKRIFSGESSPRKEGTSQDYYLGKAGSGMEPNDRASKVCNQCLEHPPPFVRSAQRPVEITGQD